MNLASWVPRFKRSEPVAQPPTLKNAMGRFFEGWPGNDLAFFDHLNDGSFMPELDVTDTKDEVMVVAEVAGIDENDIEVELSGDRLLIKGEKTEEKEEEEKNYYHRERSYGAFQREVLLPCEVEADKVTAKFKNGVLQVKLPKTPEAKQKNRRIEVKAT